MTSEDADRMLRHFQELADTGSLLEFVRRTGRDVAPYEEAVVLLSPVFEALTFGEQPRYHDLSQAALDQSQAQVVDVVTWLADSPKADAKGVALGVMRHLGWEAFTSRAAQSLATGARWERLAAIDALGHIGNQQAIDALAGATTDADPEVGAAARRALRSRRPPESRRPDV